MDVSLTYFRVLGGFEKSPSLYDILGCSTNSPESLYVFEFGLREVVRCQTTPVVRDVTAANTPQSDGIQGLEKLRTGYDE